MFHLESLQAQMVCSKATALVGGCPPMTPSGGLVLLTSAVNDECLSTSPLSMLSEKLTAFSHPSTTARSPHLSKQQQQHLAEEQVSKHNCLVGRRRASSLVGSPSRQSASHRWFVVNDSSRIRRWQLHELFPLFGRRSTELIR